MDWKLEVVNGVGERRSVRLEAGRELTLGRHADAELRLEHPTVSRHHALVGRDEEGAWVRDLNSLNGVRINERPQPSEQTGRLRLDDALNVGPVVLRVAGVFEPPADWLHWQGEIIRHLAVQVSRGDWSALPALADALEEVGCTDAEVLADCRLPRERLAGSWLADYIAREADALLGPLETRQP